MTAHITNIVPFVKRRKRPRVYIAISGLNCDEGAACKSPRFLAANDHPCGEVT